jgi:Domain of unknown function (DUF4390)
MYRRILAVWMVFGLAGGAALFGADPEPHISPLVVHSNGADIAIDFTLRGALNPDLARRIESGLATTIDYEIRLYARNRYWFDQKLDIHHFTVSVTYDPIRREYVVIDLYDGREVGRRPVHEFSEAAGWIVSRRAIHVFRFSPRWPRKNLYVMMRARFDAGHFFAFVPVDSVSDWKKSKVFQINTR